ncbi:Rieske (2Fe-2S) protein [Novosphingobium piscinae]|uniref:Non-heme iron oxygenase ferredoxin subunit n=1 Tax=Novosphingobium piscinae TaxID=1507448 RepID=A0A7X1FVJ1_9SPHN|nr:non-heme iron oxygenase ferredoxin subunit [Novosphingobium piscinae]
MSRFVPVPGAATLADNAALAVEIDGTAVLVCRSGDSFHAIANQCTHADEPLTCGRIRNGWIACPAHGARFDLASGEVYGPPATEALRTFPVRVTEGVVEVAVSVA